MAFIVRSLGGVISLLLLGCSSADTATPPASSGTGRRGAIDLEVYQAEGQTCPIGDVHVDIGVASASPPQEVADGVSGATIACTIAADGAPMNDAAQPYSAEGSLKLGSFDVSFTLLLSADSAMTSGEIHVADPKTGTDYASSMCSFELTPGMNGALGTGQLEAQFACNALTNGANTCAARSGYVLLEGCGSK